MKKVAGMLADYFYREDKFQGISYDAFQYALEFALEMGTGIFASAMIAVIFDMEGETAAFLLIFWVLRSYVGGLHLEAFWQCFLFSTAVIAGAMAVVRYFTVQPLWPHFMYLAGALAFLQTEPENDKNRRVDTDEDLYFKGKLLQCLILITIAYIYCTFTNNVRYTFVIALAVDVVYVLMILGKWKNGKNK